MEYRINEFSKMLGLSKEMIRYYEKCGAVKPSRSVDNNYRIYSTMDYFSLTEAISFSQFNANIKDIYDLKNRNFAENVKALYGHFIQDVEEEIQYKTLLRRRAEELLDRMRLGELNKGNFWIKREETRRMYPLVGSINDEYGKIELPESAAKWLHSARILPFCDGVIEFQEERDQWWLTIAEPYCTQLQAPDCQEMKYQDGGYCLCAIIDMGEIGTFSSASARSIIAEMKAKPYRFTGGGRGKLLGRGNTQDTLHRLIELQLSLEDS